MFKKFVLSFLILALAAAFAGTVPSAHSYRITLGQAAVVNGTDLKAGEYRLNVDESKITLVLGKVTVESPAKIEIVEKKYDDTAIRYTGKTIAEIRIGGTKTKIVLQP
ncbi:MAG TPA: hypothetical protein VG456_09945 [Candidatus Sulfopaludibacter sp.]|jgi:hypothetical protein|nr:hypothetical protein [Candidatus Sulfopaludibacter sp.]